MKRIVVLMLLAIAAPAHAETITSAEYGERWPFTVNEGLLKCWPPRAVVFQTSEGTYNINAAATSHYKKNKAIEELWKPDHHNPDKEIATEEIIKRGLKLCP